MDWIFQNLEKIFPVIVILLWAFAKNKNAESEDADAPRPLQSDQNEDPERTRRLQEEIRRKIAERRGSAAEPPPIETPAPETTIFSAPAEETAAPTLRPLQEELAPQQLAPVRSGEQRRAQVAAENEEQDRATYERQQRLLEKLQALKKEREAQIHEASAFSGATTASLAATPMTSTEAFAQHDATQTTAAISRRQLQADLRDPASLRRAILHREILGAPLALR